MGESGKPCCAPCWPDHGGQWFCHGGCGQQQRGLHHILFTWVGALQNILGGVDTLKYLRILMHSPVNFCNFPYTIVYYCILWDKSTKLLAPLSPSLTPLSLQSECQCDQHPRHGKRGTAVLLLGSAPVRALPRQPAVQHHLAPGRLALEPHWSWRCRQSLRLCAAGGAHAV